MYRFDEIFERLTAILDASARRKAATNAARRKASRTRSFSKADTFYKAGAVPRRSNRRLAV